MPKCPFVNTNTWVHIYNSDYAGLSKASQVESNINPLFKLPFHGDYLYAINWNHSLSCLFFHEQNDLFYLLISMMTELVHILIYLFFLPRCL